MLDKIAQGRLNKFFQESTLLNQVFEQDGKMSVKEYLKSVDKDLTVHRFLTFHVECLIQEINLLKYRNRLSNRPVFFIHSHPLYAARIHPHPFRPRRYGHRFHGRNHQINPVRLETFGIEVNDLNELRKFVGPPLKES